MLPKLEFDTKDQVLFKYKIIEIMANFTIMPIMAYLFRSNGMANMDAFLKKSKNANQPQ